MAHPPQTIFPSENKAAFRIVLCVALIGIVVLITTIVVALRSVCEKEFFYLYVMIGVWAVCPPTWFWLEYFCIYLPWGKPEAFEQFKYGQQVAGAIWAGILGTLIAFAASGVSDPSKNVFSKAELAMICGDAESSTHKNSNENQSPRS